jgi:hypothetical protein
MSRRGMAMPRRAEIDAYLSTFERPSIAAMAKLCHE